MTKLSVVLDVDMGPLGADGVESLAVVLCVRIALLVVLIRNPDPVAVGTLMLERDLVASSALVVVRIRHHQIARVPGESELFGRIANSEICEM